MRNFFNSIFQRKSTATSQDDEKIGNPPFSFELDTLNADDTLVDTQQFSFTGESSAYLNADLNATSFKHRDWSAWHYISLWLSIIICVPVLLSPLMPLQRGLSWWMVILSFFVSQILAAGVFILMGEAGTKYGVPFIMISRSTFGVRGSMIVGSVRALAGIFGNALFLWFGGQCVFIVLRSWNIGFENLTNDIPSAFDIDGAHIISFLVFLCLNLGAGMLSVRKSIYLSIIKSIVMSLFLLVLVILAASVKSTPGPIMQNTPMGQAQSLTVDTRSLFQVFFACTARLTGLWLLYAVNISDYTRYAKSSAAQAIGHAVSIPLFTTFFATLGMIMMSQLFQEYNITTVENLEVIALRITSPVLVSFLGVFLALATLVSNLYLNLYPTAYCLSNLAPKHIDLRIGVAIVSVLAILVCPWKILLHFSALQPLLLALSMQFTVVIGIMLVDYYLVNSQNLDVVEMSYPRTKYWFTRGFHVSAFAAWFLGSCALIPGFVSLSSKLDGSVESVLSEMLDYGWFIGMSVGALSYVLLVVLTGEGRWSTEDDGVEMITQVERRDTTSSRFGF